MQIDNVYLSRPAFYAHNQRYVRVARTKYSTDQECRNFVKDIDNLSSLRCTGLAVLSSRRVCWHIRQSRNERRVQLRCGVVAFKGNGKAERVYCWRAVLASRKWSPRIARLRFIRPRRTLSYITRTFLSTSISGISSYHLFLKLTIYFTKVL